MLVLVAYHSMVDNLPEFGTASGRLAEIHDIYIVEAGQGIRLIRVLGYGIVL